MHCDEGSRRSHSVHLKRMKLRFWWMNVGAEHLVASSWSGTGSRDAPSGELGTYFQRDCSSTSSRTPANPSTNEFHHGCPSPNLPPRLAYAMASGRDVRDMLGLPMGGGDAQKAAVQKRAKAAAPVRRIRTCKETECSVAKALFS